MNQNCLNCSNPGLGYVKINNLDGILLCGECIQSINSGNGPLDMKDLYNLAKKNHGKGNAESALSSMFNQSGFNPPGDTGSNKKQDAEFLTNLTEEVKENDEEILFREKELKRVVQILSRKTKNSPVIIGDPGVGKTAIAELLAKRISNNEIPRFKNHRVLSLNISSLLSGTKYRGDFEQKFEVMMNKLDDKTILFIDEIHMIMGAGSGQASDIDLSNLLKPYLSKGQIKLLGATTTDEFRSLEKDEAFNRRIQPVRVKPLDLAQTKTLLSSLKEPFEKFHNVLLPNEILDQIADLANDFVKNRNFPDKAIDILDEVSSKVSIDSNSFGVKNREVSIEELKNDAQRFFAAYGIDSSKILDDVVDNSKHNIVYPVVSELDVINVVESMTGIPVSVLKSGNKEKIRNLEGELNKSVIGQKNAISVLSKSVKRSLVRLKKANKPSVLFFAGPTGVGKTESAKTLAKTIFGSEDSLIRFDMSEFMEEHTVSKLIGSPPGYVGHEEEGQLTEMVRNNPYSIVLLDEFEKANAKVSQLFLQVFDDGRLTDNKGRIIDFSNTIIIMTSNIGTKETPRISFNVDAETNNSEQTNSALKNMYSPEFLNRIDEVVTFNSLTKRDLVDIAKLIINNYKNDVSELGVNFDLDDNALEHLVEKSYNPEMGARPLERAITKDIEDLLVDHLLEEDYNTDIKIDLIDDRLVIQ